MAIIHKIRAGDTTISLKKKGNKYSIETDVSQKSREYAFEQSMGGQALVTNIAGYLSDKYGRKTVSLGRMHEEDIIKIPGGMELTHSARLGDYSLDSVKSTTSKQKALKTWNEITKANQKIRKSKWFLE